MTPPEIILWTVALAVGLFFAWKNPTACALVLAFAASQAGLSPEYYIYPDILTLALIFCKPRYQPCPEYWDLSTWELLKCIVIERTPSDRFIMFSIPVAWYFYAPALDHQQYWALWWIAIAQFAAASLEHLPDTARRRNAEAASPEPCSRNGLEAAIA